LNGGSRNQLCGDSRTVKRLSMNRTDFNTIVDDPTVFDSGVFNLAKIFHTYYYFDHLHSEQRSPATSALRAGMVKYFLRRLVSWILDLLVVMKLGLSRWTRPRTVFYGSSGRISRVGTTLYDLYNARIVNEWGREQFIIVEDTKDRSDKTYRSDFQLSDFGLPIHALGKLYRYVYSRRLNRFADRVTSRYPELGFSRKEVLGIVSAFYANYLVNRFLLTILRPSHALLICHYGREPFIAACKRQGIPVTELQHGTMAGHPFYIYPASYKQVFDRMLLPDRIAVYGEYWRRLLIWDNIFPEDTVVVAGYYLKTPPVLRNTASDGRTVILLTTQGIYFRHWVDYIQFLTSHLDPLGWRIVIKPHPSENGESYRKLVLDGFVELSDQGTYDLLSQCDIHVSVTSTVLFEAVRYGVTNYVLFVPEAQERCAQIVATNVARPLEANQLPEDCKTGLADPSFYFADFDPPVLFPAAVGAEIPRTG
jgi:hypothetical protein